MSVRGGSWRCGRGRRERRDVKDGGKGAAAPGTLAAERAL
jgi:hypothetical protein